jgi:hypothetical protein
VPNQASLLQARHSRYRSALLLPQRAPPAQLRPRLLIHDTFVFAAIASNAIRWARSSKALALAAWPAMRNARAVLEDLVLHVRPPKGCAIVLTERLFSKPSDPNWIATVGPMVSEYARRYAAKVAELRKTDLRIEWSEVMGVDGPRRIALRHTELIERLI